MTGKQIAVVGGGVVGVCSAFFLAEAGHQVALIERKHNVAEEASFAHAGIVAPGYTVPWAAPGMPRRILSQLFKSEGPVQIRHTPDRELWRWARQWIAECELDRFRINRLRMQRLGEYSQNLLAALRNAYRIEYEQTRGLLQIFRTQQDLNAAAPALELLAQCEVPHNILGPDDVHAIEPSLAYATPMVAAVHFPHGEAGNCALFTKKLRHVVSAMGVNFCFTSNVERIEQAAKGVVLVIDGTEFTADAVVVAAGAESVRLLRPLGIDVPLYPVRGYSATATIKNFDEIPRGTVIDEAYKAAITRIGNRIRVAGTAELGMPSRELRDRALATLLKVGSDWFPGATNYSTATLWSGIQAMLPDGPPIIGTTPARNVYVNFGHGSSGWAMAAGSGKVIADIVSGRPPEIDMDGLTLARYG